MTSFTTPTGRFHIISYGNGWAYTVTCQTTGDDFFVQDDSAAQLQEDTADFTDEDVLEEYMAALND